MKLGLNRNGVATIVLAAALFALFMLKGAGVAPPPVDAASDFDTPRALQRLARILGDERPHPVDSAANDAVRARLLEEIRATGFEPEVRDDFACRGAARWNAVSCARVRNILFRAGPPDGGAIMVASHYDSVAAGPGAADDGAGVAASLEIAAILKKRRPVIPVIFLITDGEEAGLIGAHSFMKTDPLAKGIDAVINMEARGVSGPAILFETSNPNGRDITAYSKRSKAPVGNSLATDIYKMLPNDTDMTEFLALNSDAVNLAFSDRLPLYHTPQDNLANLDPRSVAHLGRSALAALDGFLRDIDRTDTAPEGQFVFADVFARFMIIAPTLAGLAMILAGLIASVTAFVRIKGGSLLRTAFAPLAAMAGAGVLAFAALSLIAAIRPETFYWYAAPHWTRAVIYLSAMTAGVAAMALAGGAERARLLAASWFWFSATGVIAYAVAPGSALLTGLPAALFACAAVASIGAPRLLAPISILGLVVAIVLWAPTLHHAEVGLGLGAAWPFAITGALLFMLAAPIAAPPVAPPAKGAAMLVIAPAIMLVGAIVFAVTAPAYSPAAPRPLNLQHLVDADKGDAFLALSPAGELPPAELSAVHAFDPRDIEGLSGKRFATPAPMHDGRAVGVKIEADVLQEFGRTMTLEFSANGADEILLLIPDAAELVETTIAGEVTRFDEPGQKIIRCSGRACESFRVIAVVGRAPAKWTILGLRHGLDASSDAVRAARPASAVPAHGGDVCGVITRQLI
jgi:hypothetical protein